MSAATGSRVHRQFVLATGLLSMEYQIPDSAIDAPVLLRGWGSAP
jgi:hypothetical protein